MTGSSKNNGDRRVTHRRLPKSFGSIRYLGESRKNPYAVHPTMSASGGGSKTGKRETLCYVPDWETGYQVLVLYNAGLYERATARRDMINTCVI